MRRMANETLSEGDLRESQTAPGSRPANLLSDLGDLAYFEVDAERNVVAMSPALERLTGFRASDVMGRSCLTVIRCSECLKGCGVFKHGDVRDARLKIYREDGSELEVFKSGKVFRDDDGTITGALEVVRPAEGSIPKRSGPPL